MSVPPGRIISLDAIRALAIMSMVIGHVANYSFLWRTSHFAYYVWDGASLFMVVSGIVVGIVYRKRTASYGMKWAAGKLLKRAGLLYVAQLALVSLALASAYLSPGPMSGQFRIPGVDSFAQAIGWALVMGANPIYVNFLSTYVVILIAAIPAIWLMHLGRWKLVVAAGITLYGLGYVFPWIFTLPNGPESRGTFDNATWFALFLSGVFAGWYWNEKSVHEYIMSTWLLRIAAPLLFALVTLAVIDALPFEPGKQIDALMAKDIMAPGRFVAAWVFFFAAYWVVVEITERAWGRRIIESLAVLGSRALDSIIILTVVTILWQGYLQWNSQYIAAQLAAIFTILLCWAWAYVRKLWSPDTGVRPVSPRPHTHTSS